MTTKNIFLTFFILFACSTVGFAQQLDSLIRLGIEYHDNGDYKQAIDAYSKALKIDPQSVLVHYEMAMTYLYAGNNKKAIEHSDFVIKKREAYVLNANIIKGSALDNMGQTKKSIKLFEQANKEYGDNYLLLYNLAVNYSKMGDNKAAEPIVIRALKNNPNHPSSHRLLAIIKKEEGQRVQSLLSYYYFLLLEPNTQRSKEAYSNLKNLLKGNATVTKGVDDKRQINVALDPKLMESDFSTAEMSLSLLSAANLSQENAYKSEKQLFIDNTKSLFKLLGELKANDKKKEGYWWTFYVPFFYNLQKTEYLDVFCHYISQSLDEDSKEWLKTNDARVSAFEDWLRQ